VFTVSQNVNPVANKRHLVQKLLIARQSLFQSYIMIVIAFAIIMCDSNVRKRGAV